MHLQPEDFQPDQHAPEVGRQQRNVEERSRGKAEQDRRERVEHEEDERVANQIAGDGAIPRGVAKGVSIEDGGLWPIDEHRPETELADDFKERSPADEDFFGDVGKPVEGCCCDGEEVAFELVGSVAADIIALQVI